VAQLPGLHSYKTVTLATTASGLSRSFHPQLKTNLQTPVPVRPPDLVQPDFLRHTLGSSAAKSLNSFWSGAASDVKNWFCAIEPGFAPGGGVRVRTDDYVFDVTQSELGIRKRDKAGVEVKALVEICADNVDILPFAGAVEIWTKVAARTLNLESAPLVAIRSCDGCGNLTWMAHFLTRFA
jgi:hypothetical protein